MSCSERLALKKGENYRDKIRNKKWLPRNAAMNTHTMNPEIEKARLELEKLKQRERVLEERLGSMYAGNHLTEHQNSNTSSYNSLFDGSHVTEHQTRNSSYLSSTYTDNKFNEHYSGTSSRVSSIYPENNIPDHQSVHNSRTNYGETNLTVNSPRRGSTYDETRESEDRILIKSRFTPIHQVKNETEGVNGDISQIKIHYHEKKVEDDKYVQYKNGANLRSNAYTELAKAMVDKKSPMVTLNRKTDEELEKKYLYPSKFINGRTTNFDNGADEELCNTLKTDINNNALDSGSNSGENADDDYLVIPISNREVVDTDDQEAECVEGHNEHDAETYNSTSRNTELINKELLQYLHRDDDSSEEVEYEIDDGIVDLRHDIHREIQINQQRERELKFERNMDTASEHSSDSDSDSVKSCISIRSKILKEIEDERKRDMEIQDQHRMRGLIPVVEAHVNSDYPDSLDSSTVKNSDTEELYDNDSTIDNLPPDTNYSADDTDSLRSKDDEQIMVMRDDIDQGWMRLQQEEELNRLRRVLSQDDMLGAETRDSESDMSEEQHTVDMRTKILKEIEEEQNRERELKMRFEREKKNVGRKSSYNDNNNDSRDSTIINTNKEFDIKIATDNVQENSRDAMNGTDDFSNARSLSDMNKQTFGSRDDLVAYLGSDTDNIRESPTLRKKKIPQTVQRITIPKVFTAKTIDNDKKHFIKTPIKNQMKQVHESILNSNLADKHRNDTIENSRQHDNTKDLDRSGIHEAMVQSPTISPLTRLNVSPIGSPYKKRNSITSIENNSIQKNVSPQTKSSSKTLVTPSSSVQKIPPQIAITSSERKSMPINERSKVTSYLDRESPMHHLNSMYRYTYTSEIQAEAEPRRKESDTSILSHDVNRNNGMDGQENTAPSPPRQVESNTMTAQWNKMGNLHKQQIEAVLQNKESSRKKETRDKPVYDKDIFPKKSGNPTLALANHENPKNEAISRTHFGNQISPTKDVVRNSINGNFSGETSDVKKEPAEDKYKENGISQSTASDKSENPTTEIESRDMPKKIPPKAKEVTVSFTISKTIQRWEKRIKKNS